MANRMRIATAGIMALLVYVSCSTNHRSTAPPASPTVQLPSGLRVETVAEGTGRVVGAGQKVRIHETLSLPDGKQIYTSRGGQPVTFTLGANQVIAGVEEGLPGCGSA
jgi:FKBP-type peptidyl-prolyl cis-trans isomerase